jgi:hypothetical protein
VEKNEGNIFGGWEGEFNGLLKDLK